MATVPTFSRLLVSVLLLLVFFSKEGQTKKKKGQSKKASASTNFFVGKLDSIPYNLEYEQLNGFMTPKNAKKLCEEDFACAGFTYKGAKDLGQKFQIKFYHFVPKIGIEIAKKEGDWTWSSYIVARDFVYLNLNENNVPWDKLNKNPNNNELLIFNSIKKQKFGISKENLDLRKLVDLKSSKSSWILKVKLNSEIEVEQQSSCVDAKGE